MIGFFRPVILLPLAAINNLSPQQIEAILLHELAHIRCNDYLLNLIQSLIDAILFFNPFAWWISKPIRHEREKSCDEMVLQLSEPYLYARALLALEEFGQSNHCLAMAATSKHPQLLHRIKNKNTDSLKHYFNSDEWKKQQREMKHIGDSVKAYFNSPEWKEQQKNLQKAMAQTKKYFQSDEWKTQQQKLKEIMEETRK